MNYYPNSSSIAVVVVPIICLILAIAGGLFLYFGVLTKKNENKFTGFMGWLYDFLNFKKMLAESILKVTYLILACFIVLIAVGTLLFLPSGSVGMSLLIFLGTLIIGNVALRLTYEFTLIFLIICRNTTEINKKMKDYSKDSITPTENDNNFM